MLKVFIFFEIKLQLKPILYAVFILSPVNIQTFTFAKRKSRIVSGTKSCNLSSTIVAPNKIKFFSMLLYTSATFSSLFSNDIWASFKSEENLLYSSWDNIFIAMNKVLKPKTENLFT